LISGLSPGHFPVFSPDAKHPAWRPLAAVPESGMSAERFDVRPKRNSGNLAFLINQVNSAIAGPGHHALVRGLGADAPSVTPSRKTPICLQRSRARAVPIARLLDESVMIAYA